MKKRLFITGLSGFVGQHLQSHLEQPGSTWELLSAAAPYDLTAATSLTDLWPQLPDAVIHLAGQTFVPEAFRDPGRTLEINLLGTLNLLQALKARGFQGLSCMSAPATSMDKSTRAPYPLPNCNRPARAIPTP